MTVRAYLDAKGPMFNGRADDAVEDLCRDLRSDVATQGLIGVMATLAQPHPFGIRKRTPYYETRLNIAGSATSDETLVVNDDNVIYGAWLEGVGTRNFPVTRFRGYGAFGRSFRRLVASLPATLQRLIGPHLRKMN